MRVIFIIYFSILLGACSERTGRVSTGLDRVSEFAGVFKGKRIGIITNHTGYDRQDRYIADVLAALPDVSLIALFGPEHGIRGTAEAGEEIDSSDDITRKIPVYSLYGSTNKPTSGMLANLDALVFDIQDVGARFYTYIWTMARCMEAAAENGKEFIVLDRPNPINGRDVQGSMLEPEFATFVGLYPIPVRHGMTVGELARMFNGEGWLENGVKVKLTVVPMKNWKRDMWYDETGLSFRSPSPNIPDFITTIVYTGTCLIEGLNVSEARGTTAPFMQIGAPWLKDKKLDEALNRFHLTGVQFKSAEFIPQNLPGVAVHPKYEGKVCYGVRLEITDRDSFYPFFTAVRMIQTIQNISGDSLSWRENHFDRLCGTSSVRKAIMENADLNALQQSLHEAAQAFVKKRQPYLLYE